MGFTREEEGNVVVVWEYVVEWFGVEGGEGKLSYIVWNSERRVEVEFGIGAETEGLRSEGA